MKDKSINDCVNGKSLQVLVSGTVTSPQWKTQVQYNQENKLVWVGVICSVVTTLTALTVVILKI